MTIKQRLLVKLRKLNQKCERPGRRFNPSALIPRDIRIGRFGDLDELSLLFHWSTEKLIPRYTIEA
jgi:hypothetical protein